MSRRLFVSVCPPGTSARFGNVPGAGAFGGFDSPAGLWLRLLLLARDVQSAVPSLRSSVVLRAVPPPLEVCCALFSVFVGVGRLSGVNKIGRLFGGASPSGFAFGLRIRASPSGFAFGPARSHDSTHNPWAMPGVVPGFPTKHPRHIAIVFGAEHRRAAFWSVSYLICGASPHGGRRAGADCAPASLPAQAAAPVQPALRPSSTGESSRTAPVSAAQSPAASGERREPERGDRNLTARSATQHFRRADAVGCGAPARRTARRHYMLRLRRELLVCSATQDTSATPRTTTGPAALPSITLMSLCSGKKTPLSSTLPRVSASHWWAWSDVRDVQ